MANLPLYLLMALALVAALAAQGLALAAREHVRARYPDWYARLCAGGGLRLGSPHDRARRAIIRPLLFGALPKDDAALAGLARRMRMAILALALSAGGFVAIVALRAQGAA